MCQIIRSPIDGLYLIFVPCIYPASLPLEISVVQKQILCIELLKVALVFQGLGKVGVGHFDFFILRFLDFFILWILYYNISRPGLWLSCWITPYELFRYIEG